MAFQNSSSISCQGREEATPLEQWPRLPSLQMQMCRSCPAKACSLSWAEVLGPPPVPREGAGSPLGSRMHHPALLHVPSTYTPCPPFLSHPQIPAAAIPTSDQQQNSHNLLRTAGPAFWHGDKIPLEADHVKLYPRKIYSSPMDGSKGMFFCSFLKQALSKLEHSAWGLAPLSIKSSEKMGSVGLYRPMLPFPTTFPPVWGRKLIHRGDPS